MLVRSAIERSPHSWDGMRGSSRPFCKRVQRPRLIRPSTSTENSLIFRRTGVVHYFSICVLPIVLRG